MLSSVFSLAFHRESHQLSCFASFTELTLGKIKFYHRYLDGIWEKMNLVKFKQRKKEIYVRQRCAHVTAHCTLSWEIIRTIFSVRCLSICLFKHHFPCTDFKISKWPTKRINKNLAGPLHYRNSNDSLAGLSASVHISMSVHICMCLCAHVRLCTYVCICVKSEDKFRCCSSGAVKVLFSWLVA